MISKLAKAEILNMQKEGLKPSFEDIIKLNALGLKVEHGKEASEFTALPRRAFVGDYILEEPSLFKKIFIDKCMQILDDDYYTYLFFMAWVLNTDDDDLPKLDNIKNITKRIIDFKNKMMKFTERQIWTAIEYVFKGNDPTEDEDFEKLDDNEKEQVRSAIDIPEEMKSVAQNLYCEMLQAELPEKCVHFTIPTVERMMMNAMMKNGVDVQKNEQAQNCAKFFACVGTIRTRLTEENKDLKD